MIKADIIEYIPKNKPDQGNTPTCSAHAFFVDLEEKIQNTTGEELEFDYLAQYERMIKFKGKRKGLYVQYYFDIGQKEGFVTKDGRYRVFIYGYRRVQARPEIVRQYLQTSGPVILGIKRFKGHSLTNQDKNGVIDDVKDGAERAKNDHVVIVTGKYPRYDKSGKKIGNLIKFQNSWKEKYAVRFMTYETFEKLAKYAFSIFSYRVEKVK